jgi:hypothetical protein
VGNNYHPDYENLPEVLKAQYTPEQYAWLGDEQRRTLQEDETTPDWEEE